MHGATYGLACSKHSVNMLCSSARHPELLVGSGGFLGNPLHLSGGPTQHPEGAWLLSGGRRGSERPSSFAEKLLG